MAERKSIFDIPPDEAEEARLDAQADAEIDAGKGVPHEQVREWLLKIGTGNLKIRAKSCHSVCDLKKLSSKQCVRPGGQKSKWHSEQNASDETDWVSINGSAVRVRTR